MTRRPTGPGHRAAALILLALAGCFPAPVQLPIFGDCEEEETPGEAPAFAPTYHRDVRPILERECVSCHQDGGIAPFSLDGYDEAAMWGAVALGAIEAGHMPPWPPSSCCLELRHERRVAPDDVEMLRAWVDAMTPEGDPADAPPPPPPGGLSRVDLEVEMPAPYTPSPSVGPSDDLRCFLIDWPIDHTTYVTGIDVVPGQRELLHHAVIYAIPEARAAFYELLDDADSEPGWSCPGGAPQDADAYVGGWVPGAAAHDYPSGLGREVKPGSKLLLSAHYELSAGPAPDQSAIRFKLDDSVATPVEGAAVVNPSWLVGESMLIPAGEADVAYSYAYDLSAWLKLGKTVTVHDVALHMHEWGSSATLGVIRGDGEIECLLHIDDWDFAWQGEYFLKEPVELRYGDRLYVECIFDNSAGNQPDGGEPQDLWWGDDKEMCIGSVLISS
ncbi:MAG: monooxygenase [Myxococcales bacterium]|nr:monooxygenase [Myxococcales bacterium]